MILNPDKFDSPVREELREILDAIDSIRSENDSPIVNRILDAFTDGQKTFVPAEFLAQDPHNPEHRLADLAGGFPFTNEAYPWPVTVNSGLEMQPLFQLNLENASVRLGVELGSGLLQAWAHVYKTAEELSENLDQPFFIRIVPDTEISSDPTWYIPDFQPWELSDTDPALFTSGCLMRPADSAEFKTRPRLKWLSPRPMFGSFHHIFSILSIDESKILGGEDEYANLAEEMASRLDFPEISIGWHSIYLGGLGGQAGGPEDPTFNNDLLIRIYDGNGFHFGICLSPDHQDNTMFNPVFRILS